MADSTITGLPAGAAITGTETVPADQSTTTVKFTIHDIASWVAANLNTVSTTSSSFLGIIWGEFD